MTSWRDPILSHFTPEIAAVARLTIVADPDQLLMEQGIIDGVRERGFEILTFDDHAAFRYAYEKRFRRIWDGGKATKLVVVLRAPTAELEGLPYDLLQEAKRESRVLSFSVAELFPSLQPHALADLDRSDFQALQAALERRPPTPLGVNATRDFLLEHVFEVALEHIRTPPDLLRILLRRHHSGRVFPASLDEHLIRLLKTSGRWNAWPLDQIVSNRADFLEFLQERWSIFVKRNRPVQPDIVADPTDAEPYRLRYAGPTDLPFGHDDVRVYMDNLFVEGLLTTTTAVPKESVRGSWMTVGVSGDEAMRGRKLLDLLESQFPGEGADHQQWLQTAQRWAEALAMRWAPDPAFAELEHVRFEAVHDRMEAAFQAWMEAHYASLSSLAPWPRPVMLHHVLPFIAHTMNGSAKRALIVVDGLSLDQWAAIRPELPRCAWRMNEGALFAWVPTLTSVSRQSIFATEPPFFFASSIGTTSKEEQHWSRFWEDRGLRRNEVAYLVQRAQEPDDSLVERVRAHVEEPRCRALAIVVGTVDEMLHGVATGTGGLHASVRHWATRGSLTPLLGMLLAADFEVSLTADHGNIEGLGIGKPDVGETAEQRGERVHVFPDERTRANVAMQYPGTIIWPPIGLPDEYLPLIAPARRAFINRNKRTVAHGGVCMEEVIVPFVRLARKP